MAKLVTTISIIYITILFLGLPVKDFLYGVYYWIRITYLLTLKALIYNIGKHNLLVEIFVMRLSRENIHATFLI